MIEFAIRFGQSGANSDFAIETFTKAINYCKTNNFIIRTQILIAKKKTAKLRKIEHE